MNIAKSGQNPVKFEALTNTWVGRIPVKRFATGLPQAFATILLGISAQVQWSWAIWMVLDLHNLKKIKNTYFPTQICTSFWIKKAPKKRNMDEFRVFYMVHMALCENRVPSHW